MPQHLEQLGDSLLDRAHLVTHFSIYQNLWLLMNSGGGYCDFIGNPAWTQW